MTAKPDLERLETTVSGDHVTISRGETPILGIDLSGPTLGHWPDGETWEELAALPAELAARLAPEAE